MKVIAVAAATLALAAVETGLAAPLPSHPFSVGIIDPELGGTADSPLTFKRVRSAGITYVRAALSWYGTAPETQPADWDPSNPNDPHYDWSAADARLRKIAAAGMTPIVAVNDAPTWARLTPEYGQSPPYPAPFCTPQVDPLTGEFTAPDRYRAMVNAAYAGIHSAVGDDMVIAGSTAP